MEEEYPLTALGAGGITIVSFWFYIIRYSYFINGYNSLFLKMSMVFLIVIILGSVLIIVLFSVVEVSQCGQTLRSLYLFIANKLTVVQRYQR